MVNPGIKPIPAVSITALRSHGQLHQLTVVGWQFVGMTEQSSLTGQISLLPEPSNPMDQGAILVLEDGIKVGYVLRRTIAPVHYLLTNFLTQLREDEDLHPEEMRLPMLVNLIEVDDRGRLHGSIKILGITTNGEVDDTPVDFDPLVPLERFKEWEAQLKVVAEGEESITHRRSIAYGEPVSLGIVKNYCKVNYPDLEYVSATPQA